MVESLADAELVDRIARGADVREAEAELCRRFAPRIRLYGLRHLRSEDRAADLVQSVLLSVLDAARSGRVEQAEQLDRFVLGTCRNVACRVRETETRTVPVLTTLTYSDVMEVTDGGRTLWNYTAVRDGERYVGMARPMRSFSKVANAVVDPPEDAAE